MSQESSQQSAEWNLQIVLILYLRYLILQGLDLLKRIENLKLENKKRLWRGVFSSNKNKGDMENNKNRGDIDTMFEMMKIFVSLKNSFHNIVQQGMILDVDSFGDMCRELKKYDGTADKKGKGSDNTAGAEYKFYDEEMVTEVKKIATNKAIDAVLNLFNDCNREKLGKLHNNAIVFPIFSNKLTSPNNINVNKIKVLLKYLESTINTCENLLNNLTEHMLNKRNVKIMKTSVIIAGLGLILSIISLVLTFLK